MKKVSESTHLTITGVSASIVAFFLVPLKLLNPFSTSWVFQRNPPFQDLSGHAIGSMFYAADSWRLPLGKIGNFGESLGSSTLYWNSNPLFSLIQKVLYKCHIIPKYFQFIGLEIFLGIVFTAIACYFLARKLDFSPFASYSSALTVVFSTSLLVHYFNDSLLWQFEILLAILLYRRNGAFPTKYWAALLAFSIWTQAYFVPIIGLFGVASIIQKRKLGFSIRALAVGGIFLTINYYLVGGFLLTLRERATSLDSARFFSCNLNCLFDSRGAGYSKALLANYSTWENYRYLGLPILILLFLLLIYILSPTSRNIRVTMKEHTSILLICFMLLAYSFGPTWKYGTNILFSFPDSFFTTALFSSFRAVSRFAIPLALILPIFVIGTAFHIINGVRSSFKANIIRAILVVILALQIIEVNQIPRTIHNTSFQGIANGYIPLASLDKSFSKAEFFKIVEANTGDVPGLPWQEFSFYALKYSMSIDTWHFLARYNYAQAGIEQARSVSNAAKCIFYTNTLYLIHKSIFDALNTNCKGHLVEVQSREEWSFYNFHN